MKIPIILSLLVFMTGCANHLSDGWKQYEQGKYNLAQSEWEKEKEKPLSELVEKAKAAQAVESLHAKMIKSEGESNYPAVIKTGEQLLSYDKWENKDWIEKSPNLKKYFTDAATSLESATYNQMKAEQKGKRWIPMAKTYRSYKSLCAKNSRYCTSVSPRISKLGKLAEEMEKKVLALNEKYKENFNCGRKYLLKEDYQKSVKCFQNAIQLTKELPEAKINTEEAEYLLAATLQSLEIQKALEAEKKKIAAAEKAKIEAENRRKAEEARKLEEARKAEEDRKIAMAKKAEAKRLKALAEKRRLEEKRKRELEERNRRWRAFLKKGSPLKPLVTTLGIPSKGRGTLALKKKQKWQAGAQLPRVKNKNIKAKDIYALGISVPKSYKLTYLKNYHGKSQQNLLRPPKTQQGKRFYYTEDYKGGRYYTEVQNRKDRKGKYQIKAIIYKIPVTR